MKTLRIAALLFLGSGLLLPAATVLSTPLEIRQHLTTYNLQSTNGVPISTTNGVPPGSDGRMPTVNESAGSVNPPTANQFQGLVSFGGLPGLTNGQWQTVRASTTINGTNAFDATVALAMQLPVAISNNVVVMVMRHVQIGAPFQSRAMAFLFGGVIPVPDTDYTGLLLTNVVSESYWLAEPYTTNNHANASYYWSSNALQVFAIQAGPVDVTWVRAAPYATNNLPAYTNLNGTASFRTNGASIYLLYTARYVASGSATKPPRKMYWTERGFRLGKPVAVPLARVGGVTVVYNNNFPRTVPAEYSGPGQTSPTDGTTNATLPELRTLWYDQAQGNIYSYNQEGRVFLELLGDPRPDNSRQHLGFEIVDVLKQPVPADVTIELGERLTPPPPSALASLFPEPVQQQGQGQSFAYQQNVAGSAAIELYATRETQNLNDYLVHWLEAGEQGLKWPALFARYTLVWPADAAKYSHYVRPPAATEDEAKETAVALATENVPAIEYQDPFDRPRAKLTDEFKFFTWLDEAVPAHRTLLRFTAGEYIAFERVFSWRDANLKSTNLAGTLGTNLTTVANYLDYPAAYAAYTNNLATYTTNLAAYNNYTNNLAAYTNYLAARTRGVNSAWKLYVSDDTSTDSGSITSWAVVVETTNSVTGMLATNAFTSTGGITINDNANATPYPSTITVSGITNAVTAVRVKLNGFSHTYPIDVDVFLVGPQGNVCALMSDAGDGTDAIGLNLVFDDAAGTLVPAPITSGTYRPTDYQAGEALPPGGTGAIGTSLAALLTPAPTVVSQPSVVAQPSGPPTAPVASTPWPDEFTAPRVFNQTVEVGQRLTAPGGELGATATYLAGHLRVSAGTSYNPGAYLDPFASGFAAANLGAIIPVNAIPGANQLEVWWYRTNTAGAGLNAGNGARGFKAIYWPSVIGRYSIQWPASPREIVLASKLGSGTLDPLEALGTVYVQNDSTWQGYNPNEEHAIMSGGTAYATRDDLNITTGAGYSSHPFVLVDYRAADGRPAMAAFQVLREKPEAGLVFDYIEKAGGILQPPMPLPLLAKPVEGSGDSAINYNQEPEHQNGDLPGGWIASDTNSPYGHYQGFTYRDRKQDFWIYRGPHAGLPALQAGRYDTTNRTFDVVTNATAVVGQPFNFSLHVSRQYEFLALTAPNRPGWLSVDGLAIQGTPATNHVATNTVELVVEDLYDHSRVTNNLTITVRTNGSVAGQAALQLLPSTNSYTGSIITFSNRPPFLAASPGPSNSFTMRYYYKTEPSFAWPGLASPPAAGSIVPYLRPWNSTNSGWVGDAAAKTTLSLEIVYRPVWPILDVASKPISTLPFGATLTKPKFDLPGVRDFKTAHILYQQSIAANLVSNHVSAVLHDPTREKYFALAAGSLDKLPGGVKADLYQGKYYFPNLPPHLAARLFFDPNRGEQGSLVLRGEYIDNGFGAEYLLLNVLRGSDLAAAMALCPPGADKTNWDNAINGLATAVETFYENPAQPGTYIPDPALPVSVEVGDLAAVTNDNTAVDSYAVSATGPGGGYVTLLEASGTAFTQPGDPVAMHIFKVGGTELYVGETKVIAAANPLSEQVTVQHTADLAGRFDEYEYEWKIGASVDGQPPLTNATMSSYLALTNGVDVPRHTIGGAGIQALGDNHVVMRYRPISATHPLYNQWSGWTKPALAEGWIKRVLAGINPFNQRLTDLFNNSVNTDVSILTQAGHRWEGDVALNLESINNYGLIEIYETVLRRGRMLSIESGYNYGPANDALLLAAGYLNDLYMMTGNESWADAANPTIGIGTKDQTYGDIATALFAFKGQTASLLEEELALLRGRDDFLLPGVQIAPVYNRLVWNYTRGIDAGEVIYALNYNIQENPNQSPDGIINAADAARMFPQGHGDAYGHYLTALKGYYSLLINSKFDWVPRIEAVTVLGQPVSVDYQDERKFAAAAAAVARAGRQIFDLTWRKDYQPVGTAGWEHFATNRVNFQRGTTRHWGLDHWATRTGQGAYLNWVVGNAILPEVDPNPNHEGIQKVDRTTVPELTELTILAGGLQTALDNAEGGLSPLGVPQGGIAFDINPNAVVGTDNGTHFEQIYQRTKVALNNAVASFDDAKDVTRLMRSEQDSLAELQATVARQELAYTNALIELYGTPYPDDIGPGKLYKQGYTGPDIVHYMYAELPETIFPELWSYTETNQLSVQINDVPTDWQTNVYDHVGNFNTNITNITFNLGSHGFFGKPKSWASQRASPGKIQQAASEIIAAHTSLRQAVNDAAGARNDWVVAMELFKASVETHHEIRDKQEDLLIAEEVLEKAQFANDLWQKVQDSLKEDIIFTSDASAEALPGSLVVGLASGGDLTSAGRTAIEMAGYGFKKVLDVTSLVRWGVVNALGTATSTAKRWSEFSYIAPRERTLELRQAVLELANQLGNSQAHLWTINQNLRKREDAWRNYRALVAEADRIQQERAIFRQRSAAVVQGFRTRDAAFRIFRNEKLERYKTLFDLSARYSLLAANAYDYETGLLNTSAGRDFVSRIINARALGVVRNGEPQFAGSNTGDPGLSSALAEMKADWDVLRGRLGFNNPDAYGTTVSLRTEALRILPGTEGDTNWKDILQQARVGNLLDDADVRRYCMQISSGDGLPVPGLIVTFSTTIADGYNLFGKELAAGDHNFSPSSFATKIFGVGVALEGYRGMDNPAANSGAVGGAGGTSPADPNVWYLDPLALSATPYVYLIPVGVDSMRSPPLGDESTIRTWAVADVAIPMPFNIGASDFSTQQLWQSGESLTEPLFAIRKHQAFRPVSTNSVFSPSLYGVGGTLLRSQFTNNRLVGRSVWNSQWKLVIPGKTLLNNPNEGLERFLQTVKDIKLHFVTYSYSGN